VLSRSLPHTSRRSRLQNNERKKCAYYCAEFRRRQVEPSSAATLTRSECARVGCRGSKPSANSCAIRLVERPASFGSNPYSQKPPRLDFHGRTRIPTH